MTPQSATTSHEPSKERTARGTCCTPWTTAPASPKRKPTWRDGSGEEAKRAGVGRIVYLGGLHPQGENMSEHLASRVRVGEILMDSGVPTAVLQAGVVIGDRSLSFQLLRHVTERVPAFVAPEWITNEITPIGARDIAFYLVAAADLPAEMNRTFDVGGPDSMPYVEMMQRYAEAVGLHRRPYFTAPIMTRAVAAGALSRRPLVQVPLNLAAAVAGTIAAGNARETGRSPWPAVVASGLGVAAMLAVTSRRR